MRHVSFSAGVALKWSASAGWPALSQTLSSTCGTVRVNTGRHSLSLYLNIHRGKAVTHSKHISNIQFEPAGIKVKKADPWRSSTQAVHCSCLLKIAPTVTTVRVHSMDPELQINCKRKTKYIWKHPFKCFIHNFSPCWVSKVNIGIEVGSIEPTANRPWLQGFSVLSDSWDV